MMNRKKIKVNDILNSEKRSSQRVSIALSSLKVEPALSEK
jgi:hypothetical protein